jgi:integrase
VKDFSKTYIFDISKDDIDKYRTKVALEISNLTSNNRLRVIKAVFKRAVEEHAIAENVVADLKKLSEKQHIRTRYLTAHELNNLVKASCETKAKFYLPAIIYLAAEHGAAKQEILDLKFSDIDFKSNTIFFNRIKNDVARTMYLMPRTRDALIAWKNHLVEARKKRKILKYEEKYVFCQVKTGTRIKEFRKSWENAKKIAKLENFHFHDLRHTYASNILTAGGDLKDVKEMIGHKDIASTDRYAHLMCLRKSNIQKQLAEHYASA